jgi:hypothetical protein
MMMPVMNNQLRKIASFSLLLSGSVPFAFSLLFIIRQEIVQHEMKEKLERQSLHTITLAGGDVRWINKKEIWVNGKMFDVKSFSINAGQYEFTGLFDEEETILAGQLKNKANKNNEAANNLLTHLFQWLQTVYSDNAITLFSAEKSAGLRRCFFSPALISPFKTILTPPPQV